MTEYEIVDEPPPRTGGPWAAAWTEAFLEHARAHPGKWIVAPVYLSQSGGTSQQSRFKAVGFECVVRLDPTVDPPKNRRLYARWPA